MSDAMIDSLGIFFAGVVDSSFISAIVSLLSVVFISSFVFSLFQHAVNTDNIIIRLVRKKYFFMVYYI
jgi:hypothetical protein